MSALVLVGLIAFIDAADYSSVSVDVKQEREKRKIAL